MRDSALNAMLCCTITIKLLSTPATRDSATVPFKILKESDVGRQKTIGGIQNDECVISIAIFNQTRIFVKQVQCDSQKT